MVLFTVIGFAPCIYQHREILVTLKYALIVGIPSGLLITIGKLFLHYSIIENKYIYKNLRHLLGSVTQDKILAKAPAGLLTGIKKKRGVLIITSKQIIFLPMPFMWPCEHICIEISGISNLIVLTPLLWYIFTDGLETKLVLSDRSNQKFEFIVRKTDDFMSEIQGVANLVTTS